MFIVQPELETRGTTSRHVQSLTLLSQPRSRVWCIVLGERHRLPGVHECWGGGGHRHCLSSSLIPSLCRVTCWRCAKRCAHGGWYKVERWHTWLLLRSGWCDVPRHQKGGMLRGNNRCGRDNARPSIPPSGRATGNDAECVAASTQSFVFHWFLRCGRRPPRRG